MTEQGNRTQQLIYRTSYRKHRERLADIRHNITTNDFLPPKPLKKPILKEQMKKEEINIQNNFLKTKINTIKNRNSSKLQQLYSSEKVKKQSKRYFNGSNQAKMQIISDLNDGQNIKFVLPSSKHNSFTFNVRSKDTQKNEINPIPNKGNSIQKCYKKYTSNSVLKQSDKDIMLSKQKQILYHLPQRNQARVVVYKKTLILNAMQSCLLQLSLINQRLLIVAYMMGVENGTLRQLFSLNKTIQLLKDYGTNYEELCSKVVIEKINNRYLAIRIMPREEEKEKIVSQEEKNKQKTKIQNQFIKRNYYTLAKNQQEANASSQKEKIPSVSSQHIQAIVDRLAAPRRLFKLRQLDKLQRQRGFSDYQRPYKNNEHSHEQLPIFKKSQSIDKNETPLNKLNQTQTQKTAITRDKIQAKEDNTEKQKDKNKDVRQQDQYQDEFDNPSQLKQKNSLQRSKLINASAFSKKSTNSNNNKMKQSSLQNESEVYQAQFDNQQQSKGKIQNKQASKINKTAVKAAQQVEEQYEQQF